jgi:hypothetical protein
MIDMSFNFAASFWDDFMTDRKISWKEITDKYRKGTEYNLADKLQWNTFRTQQNWTVEDDLY